MAEVRLSTRAKADLRDVGAHTIQTWGHAQADRYLSGLDYCCSLLGSNPGLGRACDWIRPGLRRMEKGRHIVFYRKEPGGILVCRILHRWMLPEGYEFDDESAPPA